MFGRLRMLDTVLLVQRQTKTRIINFSIRIQNGFWNKQKSNRIWL